MKDAVFDILKPLNIPTEHILRPKMGTSKIGISYHFFNEGYELYGDGKGKEFGGVLQVDVFSTADYSSAVKQIREIMKDNNFRLADSRDSDDSFSSVRYYHKILIFNYIEREVLNNGS